MMLKNLVGWNRTLALAIGAGVGVLFTAWLIHGAKN